VHTTTNINNSKGLDIDCIREDFAILNTTVHGKPLIYFDNAATTQKPRSVIDTIDNYYTNMNSNIHRGVHYLSQISTDAYEKARTKIKEFINAPSTKEIIFTRGTTESINLVAHSYGMKFFTDGDEVIISAMEHHSNIVPWQLLKTYKNINIKVIPIDDDGNLVMDNFEAMFTERTKFLSLVYVSNSLGTVNPVKELISIAHKHNVPVLIDAAQAVNHIPVDVQDLDCDFLALSGHKMYGPTGIGVLYGKEKYLKAMPPYQGGGDMISKVTFEKTTFNELPYKFEAGTPNIEGVIGLGAAIDYINNIGINAIHEYESGLMEYATKALQTVPGLQIIGNAKEKAGAISFIFENIHPHDVGTFIDFEGIALRTGHHCTQPVMDRYGIPATSRVSFAVYNTKAEIDILVKSLIKIIEVFK